MKTTRELQPRERACANAHHDLLLENLLTNCKVLTINTPRKQKVPKETNWKQKPQNENICLTYLNTENKQNFHFLSSEICTSGGTTNAMINLVAISIKWLNYCV